MEDIPVINILGGFSVFLNAIPRLVIRLNPLTAKIDPTLRIILEVYVIVQLFEDQQYSPGIISLLNV